MSANDIDVLIIGAGVIGLATARAISATGRDVLVVESAGAPGTGVSARSSEVIHAGIYYKPGSLKARLCIAGREALYAYCESHGVSHSRCGKMIVGEREQLRTIASHASTNGVELQLLDRRAALTLEPELECAAALYSPYTGVIDTHELMMALMADAQGAGASFAFRSAVESGRVTSDGLELASGGDPPFTVAAKVVILCAGLSTSRIARSIKGLRAEAIPQQRFAKGSYFSIARRAPFSKLVYPVPEPGGLGVHLTLDLAGRARFGPDVEWLDTTDDREINYAVDITRSDRFYTAIRRYWPGLRDNELIADYSGVRPKIAGPGEPDADFAIHGEPVHGARGLIALYGIESPGLTSALAIADHVAQLACRT